MNLPDGPDAHGTAAGAGRSRPREIAALQAEVRALAAERDAVILAHNYQVPEVQDVADYVGDSLGLSRQAAAARRRDDRLLRRALHGRDGLDPVPGEDGADPRPRRRLLAGGLDRRRAAGGLARASTREGVVVMYVNTTAEVKALTDYCCTSANAVDVVRHIYETHGADTEILFGPDMWLGAYVEKELGRRMHVWDGECHVHAGIRPADIEATRAAHPGADFLIHPECGCSTSVMEYVAAGDISAEGVHMLSTGGMLRYAETPSRHRGHAGEPPQVREPGSRRAAADANRRPGKVREAVVATEIGMLLPAADGRAGRRVHPGQRRGVVRVHEDDHAAEAARRAARDEVRGARARGDRRAGAGADRPHGRDRLVGRDTLR